MLRGLDKQCLMKYYDKNKLIQDDRFMRQANLRAKLIKNAYNKLSGILKVKSHHLVTSKNKWYDYECLISK